MRTCRAPNRGSGCSAPAADRVDAGGLAHRKVAAEWIGADQIKERLRIGKSDGRLQRVRRPKSIESMSQVEGSGVAVEGGGGGSQVKQGGGGGSTGAGG
jgi:hypothetical protein